MPLHLILIMLANVAFLLWLAFADSSEADDLGVEAVDETAGRTELQRADGEA